MELNLAPKLASWSWALALLSAALMLSGLLWIIGSGWENAWALGLIAVSFGFLHRLLEAPSYQFASAAIAVAAGLVWGQYQGPWTELLLWSALISLLLFRGHQLRTEAWVLPGTRPAQPGDLVMCSTGLAVVTASQPEHLRVSFIFSEGDSVQFAADQSFDGYLAAFNRRGRRWLINRVPLTYIFSGPALSAQLLVSVLQIIGLSLILFFAFGVSWPLALFWSIPGPVVLAFVHLARIARSSYRIFWEAFATLGVRPDGSIDDQRLAVLSGRESDQPAADQSSP